MVSFRVNNQNEYNIQIETQSGVVSFRTENGHRYVPLKHSTEYKVRLANPTSTRCNVVLFIDEKRMGKWRIDMYSSILLERPSDSSRKFTFVKEDGLEAGMGGVQEGSFSNGLIEAKFIPEYSSPIVTLGMSSCFSNQSFGKNCSSDENSFSAGATVLGDTSRQAFGTATDMTEDESRSVTKKIRLVVENARPQYVPLGHTDLTPPRIDSFDPFSHRPTTSHSEGMYRSHRHHDTYTFGGHAYASTDYSRYCEGMN